MRQVWATMLAVLGTCGVALAQDSTPKAEDNYYPPEARAHGQSGEATIQCRVTAKGTLTGCKVLTEKPTGMGFGAAALALSPKFRMNPKDLNGQSVAGGTVRVPITFNAPQ